MKSPKEKRFDEIVQTYSERLYYHVRRMVGFHQEADDVLQNTLLKVWLNLEKYRGDAQIYTWIYRIATNEAIEHLRKKARKSSISIEDLNQTDLQKLTSDTYFDETAAEAHFELALAALPPKQRAVFQLKYFEEMKYEEMSEVMGTSVGALKASFHHAKKKIEDFLNTPLNESSSLTSNK